MENSHRIKNIHSQMDEIGIDGLLIDSPENRYYLSGFTGTAGRILFTEKKNYFLTDFRYVEQVSEQTENFEIKEVNKNFEIQLNELLQETGVKKLGIESKSITYFQYLKYDDYIDTEIIPTHNLVEKLRMVKDKFELRKIQKAVDITDQAFEYICSYIHPGITEKELALELEFFQKKMGAEKNAFDFIVASGQRSALPHGVASDKVIEVGDFVTFDFGAFYQGYCSDMTRTVVIGEPTIEQEKVYNIVLNAQLAVIEKIQAGMDCKDVDDIARYIISEAGYGDNFGHGLGHGIGLEIHEGPRLSFSSDEVLETGMVVTDEPGIYIPEWGGVRIEDDLYITDDGCKVLNSSPKELLVIANN